MEDPVWSPPKHVSLASEIILASANWKDEMLSSFTIRNSDLACSAEPYHGVCPHLILGPITTTCTRTGVAEASVRSRTTCTKKHNGIDHLGSHVRKIFLVGLTRPLFCYTYIIRAE